MTWDDELVRDLLGELDLNSLDGFLEESGVSMTFYELFEKIVDQGWGIESISDLIYWIRDLLFKEISANKMLLLEVILITFCFSLLKNSAGNFGSSYISDVCFLMVYSVLALMLLKSVYMLQDAVADSIGRSVSFMRMFVPCFCTGMFLTSNVYVSAGFYQIAFIVIYLAQWVFEQVLLPCIHVYVILQIFNSFLKKRNLEIWQSCWKWSSIGE